MSINSYNIGEKYITTFSDDSTEEIEVVAHEFSDRHIWFKYTEEKEKYPIIHEGRGNKNEFLLPPRLADKVMTKKED